MRSVKVFSKETWTPCSFILGLQTDRQTLQSFPFLRYCSKKVRKHKARIRQKKKLQKICTIKYDWSKRQGYKISTLSHTEINEFLMLRVKFTGQFKDPGKQQWSKHCCFLSLEWGRKNKQTNKQHHCHAWKSSEVNRWRVDICVEIYVFNRTHIIYFLIDQLQEAYWGEAPCACELLVLRAGEDLLCQNFTEVRATGPSYVLQNNIIKKKRS